MKKIPTRNPGCHTYVQKQRVEINFVRYPVENQGGEGADENQADDHHHAMPYTHVYNAERE